MDLNLVVICGTLATNPEVRVFDSGARIVRYLVTTSVPKRIDVVPVFKWDPSDEDTEFNVGDRIWITGAIQRRMVDTDANGRRSRIEVCAQAVSRVHDQPRQPAY